MTATSHITTVASSTTTKPRITTRHSYDLSSGKALHSNITYRVYPKYYFEGISRARELIIMVHGLRNDEQGSSEKIILAQDMLRRLRRGDAYHIVGFSYDSNTRGANISKYQKRALAVGRRIAKANGKHLAQFLIDFKKNNANYNTKVRLLGHSLGTEVIYHAIMHLAKVSRISSVAETKLKQHFTHKIIESVHFFGSSLPANIQHDDTTRNAIDHCLRGKLLNCYAPTDDVLLWAESNKIITGAGSLGLHGAAPGNTATAYRQRKVNPKNHRFASYAAAMHSFP